eukprot:140172-Amorphochlora_amoeboformis.AAC.2
MDLCLDDQRSGTLGAFIVADLLSNLLAILAAVDMPDRPHAMLPDNSPNGALSQDLRAMQSPNGRSLHHLAGYDIHKTYSFISPPKIGEHPKLLETSAEEKFLETDAEEKPIKSSENPQ